MFKLDQQANSLSKRALVPLGLLALEAGALITPATAQEARTDVRSDDTDIVVSARKREERLLDVPVAISAFSGAALHDRNISQLTDLEFSAPGLSRTNIGSGSSAPMFIIRGMAPQDVLPNTDSPVGIYVDGVNYPRAYGADVPLHDVERVEVLKGPQGTLFGTSTTAGAVNIITKDPTYDFSGMLNAEYGNYDYVGLSGVINLPLTSDVAALRLSVDRRVDKGKARYEVLDRRFFDTDSFNARGKLLFSPTDRFRIVIAGDYTLDKGSGPVQMITRVVPGSFIVQGYVAALRQAFTPANLEAAYRALLSQSNRPYHSFNDSYDGSHVETGGVALTANYDLMDSVSIKNIISWRKNIHRHSDDFDTVSYDSIRTTFNGITENWTEELQIYGENIGGLSAKWIVGFFYNDEAGSDESNNISFPQFGVPTATIFQGRVVNRSTAVFAQATIPVTSQLNFTAGVRPTWSTRKLTTFNRLQPNATLTEYSVTAPAGTQPICAIDPAQLDSPGVCRASFDDRYSNVSYHLSLDYKPVDGLMLYLSTSRGFLSGGRNFRGNVATGSFTTFRPERATNYELGVKGRLFDNRAQFSLAGFYLKYDDIQRTIQGLIGGSAVSLVRNAASAKIKGIEFEVSVSPIDGVALNAALTYTDAGYDSFVDPLLGDRSEEPFQLSPWTVSGGAAYRIPVGNDALTARVDFAWRDKLTLANGTSVVKGYAPLTQKAYGILNARLAYELHSAELELALWGRNLTDTVYRTYGLALASQAGFDTVILGTPRTYGISVSKRF